MSDDPFQTVQQSVLAILRLAHAEGLELPAYETPGAAGMDLRAAIDDAAPLSIAPGKRALVPTGLVLEIQQGFEGQVRPRSGLAAKHGVTVLNSPGTIDSDYRGEVKVILINHGEEDFVITRGLRIAQLLITEVRQARIELRVEVSQTQRGAGGFGSTGSG